MSVCVVCDEPLVLNIADSDDDSDVEISGSSATARANQVPDDVHLHCGCHYHWQCLLDAYSTSQCPSCGAELLMQSPATGQAQILCSLHNEGGVQTGLDILPLLMEEGYLKANPQERKCRAFLEFCREGDVMAVVDMLEPDEDEDETPIDVLRYQDSLGDMQSGLHAAVQGGSREAAWLLLLLASRLPLEQFPREVLQQAEAAGITRGDVDNRTDIRSLTDIQGRTGEHLAVEMGSAWADWIGTGRLSC